MNLYFRTFSVLKPFWKQLVTASASAALHAILSGLLIWMFGPLLMTLFQVDSIPVVSDLNVTEQSQVIAEPQSESEAIGFFQSVNNSIIGAKESMKEWVHSLVAAETRGDTLVKFCWVIFIVVLGRNLFLYLQGFFMAFVQQSVVRAFRDQLFAKYQKLSLDYFHSRRTGQIISRVTNDVQVLNEAVDDQEEI